MLFAAETLLLGSCFGNPIDNKCRCAVVVISRDAENAHSVDADADIISEGLRMSQVSITNVMLDLVRPCQSKSSIIFHLIS